LSTASKNTFHNAFSGFCICFFDFSLHWFCGGKYGNLNIFLKSSKQYILECGLHQTFSSCSVRVRSKFERYNSICVVKTGCSYICRLFSIPKRVHFRSIINLRISANIFSCGPRLRHGNWLQMWALKCSLQSSYDLLLLTNQNFFRYWQCYSDSANRIWKLVVGKSDFCVCNRFGSDRILYAFFGIQNACVVFGWRLLCGLPKQMNYLPGTTPSEVHCILN